MADDVSAEGHVPHLKEVLTEGFDAVVDSAPPWVHLIASVILMVPKPILVIIMVFAGISIASRGSAWSERWSFLRRAQDVLFRRVLRAKHFYDVPFAAGYWWTAAAFAGAFIGLTLVSRRVPMEIPGGLFMSAVGVLFNVSLEHILAATDTAEFLRAQTTSRRRRRLRLFFYHGASGLALAFAVLAIPRLVPFPEVVA